MKRKSLLVLLLSILMVLSPALSAFADSEDNENEAVCSHDGDTYTLYEGEYVEIEGDDRFHRIEGDIYEVIYCNECDEMIDRIPCDTDYIEEGHEYGYNHVCTLCGHENQCEHPAEETFEWYDYDEDDDDVEIEDIGDQHSITGDISKITHCEYCGEDFETVDLGYTTVYEDHYYENGVCELCFHRMNDSWSDDGNYYYEEGKPVKEWKKIDGDWYYFDKVTGKKKTKWLKDNGYWYYLDPSLPKGGGVYGAMATGWKSIEGKRYYFEKSGKMKTGWLKIDYKYDDGDTDTSWYYFNSGGAQLFGWQKISNKWYYFEEIYEEDYDDEDYEEGDYDSGYMATGYWPIDSAGKAYLFAGNGVWRSGFTGWYSEEGSWYYFKKGVGVNGWQKINSTWYYFENGWMYANEWASDKSGEYWMGSNGKITKNKWIQDFDGKWYYMGSDGHPVCNKWRKDSKGWCYLDENGIMVTDGWAPDSKGMCWIGPDGYMVEETKWIEYESDWYYIVQGYRVENETKWIDDGSFPADNYIFGSDGVCENPPA